MSNVKKGGSYRELISQTDEAREATQLDIVVSEGVFSINGSLIAAKKAKNNATRALIAAKSALPFHPHAVIEAKDALSSAEDTISELISIRKELFGDERIDE